MPLPSLADWPPAPTAAPIDVAAWCISTALTVYFLNRSRPLLEAFIRSHQKEAQADGRARVREHPACRYRSQVGQPGAHQDDPGGAACAREACRQLCAVRHVIARDRASAEGCGCGPAIVCIAIYSASHIQSDQGSISLPRTLTLCLGLSDGRNRAMQSRKEDARGILVHGDPRKHGTECRDRVGERYGQHFTGYRSGQAPKARHVRST